MLLILLRQEKRKKWVVAQYSDNSDIKTLFYTQCSVYDQPFISNSMESCCEDNAQSICMRNGFCKAFKETQVEIMASFICQNGKEDCPDQGILMDCNFIPRKLLIIIRYIFSFPQIFFRNILSVTFHLSQEFFSLCTQCSVSLCFNAVLACVNKLSVTQNNLIIKPVS